MFALTQSSPDGHWTHQALLGIVVVGSLSRWTNRFPVTLAYAFVSLKKYELQTTAEKNY